MARYDSAPDEPRSATRHEPLGDEFAPRGTARREPTRVLVEDDDDFDARLLDLDIEEQSPFLRGQKRVPVRRGALPRSTANRLRTAMFWGGSLGFALLAGWFVYSYGAHSWRFQLASGDDIRLAGLEHVSKAQVLDVFGTDIGRNIFFVPLEERKKQLEHISWVQSATVMRLLPDRLAVSITERKPVAFVQVGSRIHLIDAEGVLMDMPPRSQNKYSFPVLVGMAESEPLSTRAARMAIFGRVLHELNSDGARYGESISEINVNDPADVKVTMPDDAGAVLVHLGDRDFLTRFQLYQTHVREWRNRFQRLESVDLRYDQQVIVNPDPAATRPTGTTVSLAPTTPSQPTTARPRRKN